jgi:hypothetical protein
MPLIYPLLSIELFFLAWLASTQASRVERRRQLGFHRDAAPPATATPSAAPSPGPTLLLQILLSATKSLPLPHVKTLDRAPLATLLHTFQPHLTELLHTSPASFHFVSTQKLDPVVLCSLHTCSFLFSMLVLARHKAKEWGWDVADCRGEVRDEVLLVDFLAPGYEISERIRVETGESEGKILACFCSGGRTGELLCSSLFIWLINYHVLARQL